MRRAIPCLHEEAVREWCQTCASGDRHVRGCGRFDATCTRTPVSAAIRSCDLCDSYSPEGGEPYSIRVSSRGIGDAVCGLYAACGLADATGRPVVFRTGRKDWLTGVSHPGVHIEAEDGTGADAFDQYDQEKRAAAWGRCPTRADWYCRRVADRLGIGEFRPMRPKTVEKPTQLLFGGYDVASPYSDHGEREWATGKWVELVRSLCSDGAKVVMVGSRDHAERFRIQFGHLPVVWYFGMEPAWVVAAVAHARRVYANDSGIAHVAGLHGVPTAAVMTHLKGEFVFGDTAPSVRGVGADPDEWPCQGCAWQADKGHKGICVHGCPALLSLGVNRVRAVFQK